MNRAMEPSLEKGLVDLPQLPFRFGLFDPNNDTIRMVKIADRRSLAQELGIGGNAKFGAGVAPVNFKGAPQLLAGLGGNRAFFDDKLG